MSADKIDRKFKRVALTQETVPSERQAQGVPAKLLRGSFFNFVVCNSVLKNISVGGAGALVPAAKKVPDKVKVLIANQMSLNAKVVHRKQISDELMFLGLDWSQESEKKFKALTKLVNQLGQHNADVDVKHERTGS